MPEMCHHLLLQRQEEKLAQQCNSAGDLSIFREGFFCFLYFKLGFRWGLGYLEKKRAE